MSRVGIMQDIPAHLCWQYIHGNLSHSQKSKIYDIVSIAIPGRRNAIQFIREIAYRVGYAKSNFVELMSEVTYKKKKQWCRSLIEQELAERSEK